MVRTRSLCRRRRCILVVAAETTTTTKPTSRMQRRRQHLGGGGGCAKGDAVVGRPATGANGRVRAREGARARAREQQHQQLQRPAPRARDRSGPVRSGPVSPVPCAGQQQQLHQQQLQQQQASVTRTTAATCISGMMIARPTRVRPCAAVDPTTGLIAPWMARDDDDDNNGHHVLLEANLVQDPYSTSPRRCLSGKSRQVFVVTAIVVITAAASRRTARPWIGSSRSSLLHSQLRTASSTSRRCSSSSSSSSTRRCQTQHGNLLVGTLPTAFEPQEAGSFSGGGIAGTIPTELGMLVAVTSLILHDNPLVVSGTIPTEMGQATRLQLLRISNMGLFGTLPTEHGSMTKLEQARMSRNLLAGTIPTAELGSCFAMQLLELDRNSPTGTLPTELARMAQLATLRLSDDALTGPIPSDLGTLDFLEELSLGGNPLIEAVPPQVCERMSTTRPRRHCPVCDDNNTNADDDDRSYPDRCRNDAGLSADGHDRPRTSSSAPAAAAGASRNCCSCLCATMLNGAPEDRCAAILRRVANSIPSIDRVMAVGPRRGVSRIAGAHGIPPLRRGRHRPR
jgi:hypothetical protein